MAGTNVWVAVLVAKCQSSFHTITHDYLFPSLSFNVSKSSGNSNLNLASVTSNFGLGLHQFECTAAQSLGFLQDMILRVFLLINFNIITRNYCLNKTSFAFKYMYSLPVNAVIYM